MGVTNAQPPLSLHLLMAKLFSEIPKLLAVAVSHLIKLHGNYLVFRVLHHCFMKINFKPISPYLQKHAQLSSFQGRISKNAPKTILRQKPIHNYTTKIHKDHTITAMLSQLTTTMYTTAYSYIPIQALLNKTTRTKTKNRNHTCKALTDKGLSAKIHLNSFLASLNSPIIS